MGAREEGSGGGAVRLRAEVRDEEERREEIKGGWITFP